MALAIGYGRLLLLQISVTGQRTISGSGNFLKPQRRQLVQRKLHFKGRLCWMWRISAGRALRAGARWRRGSGAGRRLPPVGSGMATAGPEWPLRSRNGPCGAGSPAGLTRSRGEAAGAPSRGQLCPRPASLPGEEPARPPPPQRSESPALQPACQGLIFFLTNCSSKQTLNRYLRVG